MSAQLSMDFRQQQQQLLAPQLQQSLKMLQVTSMELQSLIDTQLATNPTLEEYDPTRDDAESLGLEEFDPDIQDLSEQKATRNQTIEESENEIHRDTLNNEKACEKELANITSEDETFNDYFESQNNYGKSGLESVSYKEYSPKQDEWYNYKMQSISVKHNLSDELKDQYISLDLSEKETEIFQYLIGSLDKNGFLKEDAEKIAEELRCEPEPVEKLIETLKSFYPPGIGAKDLKECLLIQLDRLGSHETFAYQLISDFYNELLHNQLQIISKKSGKTIEEIQDAIHQIGTLDPKPGRDLSTINAPVIIPDIIVTRKEDGSFYVETNDNLLPYIRVIPSMKKLVKDKTLDKQDKKYLKNEIYEGETLVNNLQFRKRTVLAVAESIVERQKEFFNNGYSFLKPLCMKTVANEVGVHEATVSRTVNGKYMDTPQGIIEMRYFFSSNISGANETEVSTNAAKAKLREVVESEDKQKPYSDEKLAEKLTEKGISIARRTVVKYRKALNIPNMRHRKEFK